MLFCFLRDLSYVLFANALVLTIMSMMMTILLADDQKMQKGDVKKDKKIKHSIVYKHITLNTLAVYN